MGIGWQSQYKGRWYTGTLDEARVLTVPKDVNWVKLNFDTQGRLVASLNASGDANADKVVLGRRLRAGVYVDKWIGLDGALVKQSRAAVP
ncbi:MAG: hypothetical protein M3Y08_14065 [Fibrobacterota bacterium]|nr:hypothetical protein [Fibrobacterota bacterium]